MHPLPLGIKELRIPNPNGMNAPPAPGKQALAMARLAICEQRHGKSLIECVAPISESHMSQNRFWQLWLTCTDDLRPFINHNRPIFRLQSDQLFASRRD
jgi:hypothetical protein